MLKKSCFMGLTLACLSLFGIIHAAETQTTETDWCTIITPNQVDAGKPFNITVTFKDIADGLKFRCDLHWHKPEGVYGGFNRWGGQARDVSSGQTITHQLTAAEKDGMASVHVLAFLSPAGEFNDAVKKATSASIIIAGAPQTLPSPSDSVTYKKSWISIASGVSPGKEPGEPLVEGDPWEVAIEYFVDPEDDWGGTKIRYMGLGPWVDNPDGVYTVKRSHHNYPGTSGEFNCVIGERATHTIKMRIPACHKSETGRVGDSMTFFVNFQGADNKNWSWHVRGGGVRWTRSGGFFELDADTPGNLFTYAEPVVMQAILRNVANPGETKTLNYTVINVKGEKVTEGSVQFKVEADGQKVPVPLDLSERGTFLITATVDGWETREITFARIPDVMAITRGERTRFGSQYVFGPSDSREGMEVMRKLGLTIHRTWLSWNIVQPWPGEWRQIDSWKKSLDLAKELGIDSWLCFLNPPMWALDGIKARDFSYAAFPFRDEDLHTVVDHLTREFKGKFIGWEWLNEIVPGAISPDPVNDYVRFCKVGTETSKAIDPNLINSAAGGLFPRAFRQSLLSAGLADHVDVLPIHYGNGGTIMEARSDLARVGAADRVIVWDNETGRGLSTWHMPLTEAITRDALRCNWILNNWTDQVMVDTEKIVYFAGAAEPAGNWSYLWGDFSPRPLAATLAVFTSKMHGVKPLGVFMLGDGGVFHLFETEQEKPLLVAGSHISGGEKILMHAGSDNLILTDNQGNETTLAAGAVELDLTELRYFVEGGDLDVLKAYVVPSIVADSAAEKRGALLQKPIMTMLTGGDDQVFVLMRNLYERELTGSLSVLVPDGWPVHEEVVFSLAPGAEEIIPINIHLPDSVEPGDFDMSVRIKHDWNKLPTLDKSFFLTVISPDMLGNLLVNPGFEEAGSDETRAAHWSHEPSSARVPYEGDNPGHGKYMLAIRNAEKYSHISQTTDKVRPGQTYLYSMWVHTDGVAGGSNIYLKKADGTTRNIFNSGTFMFIDGQPWHFYSCTVRMPDDVVSATFTPVGLGAGFAHFDNLRVTVYEGTMFAAEAHKPAGEIKVDGKLDDWDERSPIPLFSSSQLTRFRDSYEWDPANLSGVAYVRWTDKGLYLALDLRDDRHVANHTGDRTMEGDSVVIGIHPANKRPNTETQAHTLYFSSAKPGGGSGAHTVYRPAERSGGLSSGQRYQDSSVYEIVVNHDDGRTVYEIFMPYMELGFTGGLGAKIGISIKVNDNDGDGRAAMMQWGDGLHPSWDPNLFGVLTLVE